MKAIGSLLILIITNHCNTENVEDVLLQTENIVNSYGFNFENHEVITEDDYILTTLRIWEGNETKSLKPILFVHGMYGKCEDYLLLGNKSIAYILAKRSYDIWLMNARGSLYSKKHKVLNPKKDFDFWKFSWHEIGYYDVPANIDYILNVTQNTNLFYLGHSQGGTTYYVLTSTRPEYNNKIRASVNFAPALFRGSEEKSPVTAVAKNVRLFESLREKMNWFELFPKMIELSNFVHNICALSKVISNFCLFLMGISAGKTLALVNSSVLPYAAKLGIGGGSTFQALHYLQNAKMSAFRQYDFGEKENLKKYKHVDPPDYDTTKSTAPVLNFYLLDDHFAPKIAVESITNDNPNGKGYIIEEKSFTHFDFALSEIAYTLAYEPTYEYLEGFN